MRKTKIICTLGPATEKTETLQELMTAGADVFRVNMSHAEHAWVRDLVPRARKLAHDLEHPLAFLLDTQGPAIRTGGLAHAIELKPGDLLELTVRGAKAEAAHSVDVNYDGLIDDVSLGNKILIDNGLLQLVVTQKSKNRILCKALTAGSLGSRRHINLPGVHVNLPPLTKKDLHDVDLGIELGFDFVALSFARQTSDLEALRKALAKKGSRSTARIVAKIEEQSAVKQIDEMIKAADAIMVARGDLGIECPMEELPIIQRRIVKRSLRIGKPVIVATHMLESMIVNPVADASRDYRCRQRRFRAGRCNHVEWRNEHGPVSGRVRQGLGSGGAPDRAERRRRLRAECDSRRFATKNRGLRRGAGQLLAEREAHRLHAPRNDGALRFQHAPGTCARSSPSPQAITFIGNSLFAGERPRCGSILPRIPTPTSRRRKIICATQRLSREGDNLVIISDTQSGDAMVDCVQLRKA